jgi:hypothetical protein
MLGTKKRSSWNRDRRDTSRRLNSLVVKRPSSRGAMKEGQRRVHAVRKEMISRPECLERVSQTAEQKRVQMSLISSFFGAFSLSFNRVSLGCDDGA